MLCRLVLCSLLRSAVAGRIYKLCAKHTSNSGFDRTFMPCLGYFYALPNKERGTKYRGLTYSAKQTVREICRATYSASQTRLRNGLISVFGRSNYTPSFGSDSFFCHRRRPVKFWFLFIFNTPNVFFKKIPVMQYWKHLKSRHIHLKEEQTSFYTLVIVGRNW